MAELTVQDRAKLVAEWAELTGEVLRQLDAKPKGGRPEGGARKAARELGIPEPNVRRAIKIASLSPEAQAVAVETGQDDIQTALLPALAVGE
ncbi:MAG: hypothetical protein GYA47_11420 [Desulfovibrio sp.]|nr:hypothetical protein [Desulfovibrio sp.]